MTRRSVFFILGLIWDLLRFFLLFAFLTGNRGTGVLEGNFFILLLGISGQPALTFLWKNGLEAHYDNGVLLPAVRFPGLIVEFFAVILFFMGKLPGQGDTLLFENTLFPGGTGLLLLLFILLIDIIFQVILLILRREEL
ncbi:MAG: hypothetical protein JEY99_12750 [Spirochaetales bacterium]|nr:hypothetical protein [Spirochaetales bacterium]